MYPGPLRQEPLAIELHNTLYAVSGTGVDGLAEEAGEWLEALAYRFPYVEGDWPGVEELVELRESVRAALQFAVAGDVPDAATLDAINAAAARATSSPAAVSVDGEQPNLASDFHGATRADIVIGTIAGDAIELLTGNAEVRACGAPGCVLLFLKDHPRREWCSNACGNRVRQARHYARTRAT
jgi:predicted RNA-binding Zn ribbon-like protein